MEPSQLEFQPADLDDPRVGALLSTHAERALAGTHCREGHALSVDALRDPAIEVWSIWRDDAPVAVGALRRIDSAHCELKSMFVADPARGLGVGRRLLDALVATARDHGMTRLSLETGASDYFDAARRLYAKHGFEICEAFADLPPHPDSVFMSREI